jgi:hypothetical protein
MMATRRKTLLFPALTILAGFLFACSLPARADDDDPPGRVARLNYIQGSISYQPGGETDWVQANPNRPLTTGDNLWTDRDSRGELHIGSTSIRIGSETGITFLNLDDRTVQIQLAQGSLNVHVRRLEGGDAFEIDTPSLAFTLDRPGDYRLDVDPSGNSTQVGVREGEGLATGGGSEYHMDSGDQATFSGTDTLTYDGGQVGRPDDFDEWCSSRDDREDHANSAHYVSRDVTGYDDLDDNGDWRNVPDYGYVWFPTRVAAGWAPYHFGHWVWVAPWGWTWVEDEPWGFAPFHYGRWAEFEGRWCWVPGPVVVRPVYAPALVVFVGGAGSFGGGVAWFPLGPREVYVPPYHVTERYVQRVNVTNTTVNVVNVTNVYNNVTVNKITYMHQNNVAAITAVSHETFVNARPVGPAAVRVTAEQARNVQIQRGFTVAPVQKSVVGAAPPATVRPPQAVMQRQVVAKQVPPPPRPSFNGTPQAAPRTTYVQQGRVAEQQKTSQAAPQAHQSQQPAQQARPGFRPFQEPPSQPPAQQQSHAQPYSAQPSNQPQNQSQSQARPAPNVAEPNRGAPPPPSGRPVEGSGGQQTPRPAFTPPPASPNPNVKMAPPARANENTYQPHQFERPQHTERPQNAAPLPSQKPQERAPEPQQERSQPKAQESNRPENEKRK